MPEDTVRGLRINLISVKDHSKYFGGGALGASSSPWLGRKWGWRWSSAVMCVGCGGPWRGPLVPWASIAGGRDPGVDSGWAFDTWVQLPEGKEGLGAWDMFIFWMVS